MKLVKGHRGVIGVVLSEGVIEIEGKERETYLVKWANGEKEIRLSSSVMIANDEDVITWLKTELDILTMQLRELNLNTDHLTAAMTQFAQARR